MGTSPLRRPGQHPARLGGIDLRGQGLEQRGIGQARQRGGLALVGRFDQGPEDGGSPVFESLQAFLEAHPDVPHLAIGGIDASRARELARLGCRGVAVSSAICGAERPEVVAREILQAIQPVPESVQP